VSILKFAGYHGSLPVRLRSLKLDLREREAAQPDSHSRDPQRIAGLDALKLSGIAAEYHPAFCYASASSAVICRAETIPAWSTIRNPVSAQRVRIVSDDGGWSSVRRFKNRVFGPRIDGRPGTGNSRRSEATRREIVEPRP
jgi:hypothetical protein